VVLNQNADDADDIPYRPANATAPAEGASLPPETQVKLLKIKTVPSRHREE